MSIASPLTCILCVSCSMSSPTTNYSYDLNLQLQQENDARIDIVGPSGLLPNQDPIPHDGRTEYLRICVPLYQAALKGDWESAEAIIDEQNDIVSATITSKSETALHIAVASKHKEFVRNLLQRMNPRDLDLQNSDGNTALCFAAASGVVEVAEMMICLNPDLPLIRGGGEMTPIHMAALFSHSEMVLYLYEKTKFRYLSGTELINLFFAIISADIFDVALRMLREEKELAFSRNSIGETALHLMARKPYAISHEKQLNLFQSLAISSSKGLLFREAKLRTLAHQLVEELWKSVVQLPMETFYIY